MSSARSAFDEFLPSLSVCAHLHARPGTKLLSCSRWSATSPLSESIPESELRLTFPFFPFPVISLVLQSRGLPFEIQERVILECTDPSTLARFCRVRRDFLPIAGKRIYVEVATRPWEGSAGFSFIPVHLFISQKVVNPRLQSFS